MKIPVVALSASFCLLAVAHADTFPLPHQKLGLWQQTFTSGGGTISDQVCLDAVAEAKISALSASFASRDKTCKSRQVTHNVDGSWNVVSVCEVHPGWTMKNHAVITGDFDSKYRSVIDTTTTGAPTATLNGTHQTVLVASWLGPCKPGQRGGDLIMSNGVKVNILGPSPH